MLIPSGTTAVPNAVFDYWMPKLKPSALCILLLIIRQTLGRAKDKENKEDRKERDWISSSQLQDKTGYSRRAISVATEILVRRKLIKVYDYSGKVLRTPQRRKGKQRLFYGLTQKILLSQTPVKKKRKTSEEKTKKEKAYSELAEDIGKKSAALAQQYRIT